jgi:hypothetical protein
MKEKIKSICQAIHAGFVAPKTETVQFLLLAFGVTMVSFAFASSAMADVTQFTSNVNFTRLDGVIGLILGLIEGRFGILIMLCAGIGAIVSSAFGQYRAALSLLVVALGAFILRSLITVFFDTTNIDVFQQEGDIFNN